MDSEKVKHLEQQGIKTCMKCPSGYTKYQRTPTEHNGFTKFWCMKIFFFETPIKLENAGSLCEMNDAVLTAYENQEEKDDIKNQMTVEYKLRNFTDGLSVAMDGKRREECITDNSTVLNAPPCNNASTIFTFSDTHTDPSFFFTTWGSGEPSRTSNDDGDFEACLQFRAFEGESKDGTLNDFFCDALVAPHNPGQTLWMNYGVLCGREAL